MQPIVQQLREDTMLCFTVKQAKEIAKLIQSAIYKDSLNTRLEHRNTSLYLIGKNQENTIALLNQKVEAQFRLHKNQSENMRLLHYKVDAQQKTIRKGRKHKALLGIALGAVTFMAIRK